mmetsp:Transcript_39285/g.94992  ORF Transcript_39285/g.94992 Transcript_39285/m.94992 type:complete len:400 (+) Transcript_39285:133-1332(+)
MDTKNNIEEPVPVTVTDSAAAATGPDDGDGVDGGGNTSATGGDHVDVVNNMVPKSVPWASVKVSPEDESIIQEVDDIKNACYFLMPDWKTRQSKFWLLLILACIIAAAGVVGDSAATVIGAMIVAPLMMPIQGLMVSTVLLDKNNWFFSSFMVLAGVGSSICIGAIFGAIMNESQFTKENNTEVSSRINPALTDLLGALATGTVGAIALVRKDIAGALPGVSISISLVPPLIVCGLMLSIQDFPSALGSFLLWFTNFLCIQVMGIVTMYVYGIHTTARRHGARLTRAAFLVCVAALCLTAIPLYFTSQRLAAEADGKTCIENLLGPIVEEQGWRMKVVVTRAISAEDSIKNTVLSAAVTIVGPPPFPDFDTDIGDVVAEACPDVNEFELTYVPALFFEL